MCLGNEVNIFLLLTEKQKHEMIKITENKSIFMVSCICVDFREGEDNGG